MKKTLVLVVAAFALVGCGNGAGSKTTTTVCSIDKPIGLFSSVKQTIISEGDVAKKIEYEEIYEGSSKEEVDATLPQVEEVMKSTNSLEGVTATYERVNDTSIKNMVEYDLEKVSIQTLARVGLIPMAVDLDGPTDEDVRSVSVEQTVKSLEVQGFTCSVE